MEDQVAGEYLEKLNELLFVRFSPSPKAEKRFGPSKLLDYLYLGNREHADCIGMLTDIGITHVLNCAGSSASPYSYFEFGGLSSVRSYHQIEADDNETYNIISHLDDVTSFIQSAKDEGGKVLIYCVKGRNRSAALAVAFLMIHQSQPLLEAVKTVAEARRGTILTNPGFRRQLIHLAAERQLLK